MVSRPYVQMTLEVLEDMGIEVTLEEDEDADVAFASRATGPSPDMASMGIGLQPFLLGSAPCALPIT